MSCAVQAYLETSEDSNARWAAVNDISRLLRKHSISALSSPFKSRFLNQCPILSVQVCSATIDWSLLMHIDLMQLRHRVSCQQDMQCTENLEHRQFYCDGEPVGTVLSGNNILFAAEHDGKSGHHPSAAVLA